ncbi:phosphotransferase enzyme family protein [Deinococcus malanensis]|uniref:phosphotransferase enzyme family protein n=1 Tax=Deinococcus malanensis TaxID=1706855 RepID=UPI00362D6297
MSAEPALDRAALKLHLHAAYGMQVETLSFLSAGTLPAYRADGPGGRFFIKIVPGTRSGVQAAQRLASEAVLLHELNQIGDPLRVPRLLPTRDGADLSTCGTFRVAVFTWIEAVNLGSTWEDALPELADLLGHLHAHTSDVTARLQHFPCPPEDFALPFEVALLKDLSNLAHLSRTARPGMLLLRDLLLEHEATVRHHLKHARALRVQALSRPQSFVLCHTDAHGGNVMRDANEQLWLVDWEMARLAPLSMTCGCCSSADLRSSPRTTALSGALNR